MDNRPARSLAQKLNHQQRCDARTHTLDRLTHHCHVLETGNESYCLQRRVI
ncbi:ATP-binding protein [Pseudomonas sp. SXM-1]|uniref:ATP-binding protein n=1 Tax=unclassified Pseudomonas TaxID=196821 RepID=UPI003532575F